MEYKTLADMLWEAEEKREQVGRLTDALARMIWPDKPRLYLE